MSIWLFTQNLLAPLEFKVGFKFISPQSSQDNGQSEIPSLGHLQAAPREEISLQGRLAVCREM